MTELDELDRQMDGLKKLLRIAWSDLANPLLAPLERRETRDQIKLHSAELRRYLENAKANCGCIRNEVLESDANQSSEKLKFLLLAPLGEPRGLG